MKKFLVMIVPKIIGFFLNILSFIAPKLAAKKALYLFASPRKGRVLENQQAFLNTSHQEELSLNDINIMTYHWKGNGKTVLLVHGWESNTFRWHKLVSVLQTNNYNIVALDAPAHGSSGGKQFNALLYADFINVVTEKYSPEIIIGHSVGGMASAFFQKIHNYNQLEKLVLLGAPSEFSKIFSGYRYMMGYNTKLTKALRELVIERFGNTPESFSTANYLKDASIKGLIIHDKKDKIISYDEAILIHEKFKRSKLISTTGLGHSLHHDSVNQHILEFLNT